VREERREERALLGAAERERLPAGDDFQRPEPGFHAFPDSGTAASASTGKSPFCSDF